MYNTWSRLRQAAQGPQASQVQSGETSAEKLSTTTQKPVNSKDETSVSVVQDNFSQSGGSWRPRSPGVFASTIPHVLGGTLNSTYKSQTSREVIWQWRHRSGWRDYDAATCAYLERCYAAGQAVVRVKSGKDQKTVLEIFFADMVQHDPKTNNVRDVRRLGPETLKLRIRRYFREWVVAFETGKPYRMSFEHYQRQRRRFLGGLERDDFHAAMLYWDPSESIFARITRHPIYWLCQLVLVFSNALWLGVDADDNLAYTIWNAPTRFQVAEHTFAGLFCLDLVLRLLSFKEKKHCFRDGWFLFDFIMTGMMLGETWILQTLTLSLMSEDDTSNAFHLEFFRMLRLIRLTRLARFVRLLNFSPELFTILKGIIRATASVFYTTVLLCVFLYVMAIIFKIKAEVHPGLVNDLGTVGDAMWYLLLHGTFLDAVADVIPNLRAESPLLTTLFMMSSFITSLTLLNMLVGILVEVVQETSQKEKETMTVFAFKSHLLPILEAHDVNNNGSLRMAEFELLLQNPETHRILGDLGVDAKDMSALKHLLFDGKEYTVGSMNREEDDETSPTSAQLEEMQEITFAEFMEVALRLRGGNQAKVKDIVELREYVKTRVDELHPLVKKALHAMPKDIDTRDSSPHSGSPTRRRSESPHQASASSQRRPSSHERPAATQEMMYEAICDLRKQVDQLHKRLDAVGPNLPGSAMT